MARDTPPDGSAQTMVLTFLSACLVPLLARAPDRPHLVDRCKAAHIAQILEENRDRLHPVSVAIDHGVIQSRTDLCRSMRHGRLPLLLRHCRVARDFVPL